MGMYLGGQKISPIIKSEAEINNQDKTITENGIYAADADYTGLGEVTVNVPSGQPVITGLNVTPTTSAQTIVAPSGTDGYSPVNVGAVTSSIDNNITAENIKKDVQILGVTGNVVELNGETRTITPTTFQQVITPSSGKNAITQATVEAVTSSIDNNIIAGNIKKNVTILGVTGTLEGGVTPTGTINITQNGTVDVTNYASANVNVSGGGGSTTGFLVQVIDYDGTVLKSEKLDTGDTFTLPSQPSHTGLTFQSWSSPVTITNNTVIVTDSDITIGAIYTTASGLSEFDITLTENTGLSVTLNMDGTKNWGDGTSDTSTTHTYASAGDYTITCSGSTMTTSSSSGLFGQASSAINYYVKDVRLGSNVTSIGTYAFASCYSLTSISIPSSVTSIGTYAFYTCHSLTSITIPSSIVSISSYMFRACNSLASAIIPSSVTSIGANAFYYCYSLTSITIPEGVTSIGANAFASCYSLASIIIPSSVTSIDSYAFSSCNSLTSITIPEGVTSIGDRSFFGCYSLTSITIPGSITSIGNYVFQSCSSLTSVTILEGVTSIGNSMFYGCNSLASVIIPSSVTSIGSGAFTSCFPLLEYDFSNHIAVPTLSNTNAFSNINGICKIRVPKSLETTWKTETNWSTYADYIVGV